MRIWYLPIVGAVVGTANAQVPTAPTPGLTARAMADTVLPDTNFKYSAQLTMDQVVTSALRYSPAVASARGAVHSGLSGERVAYGTFLPNVIFNADALQQNTKSTPSSLTVGGTPSSLQYAPNAYWAGLSASYDLFTGGRRPAQIAAAKATTHAADAALVEQKYNTALTAQQSAYGVLRGHDLVQVSVTRIQNAVRSLDYASSNLRAGTATRADVLQAQLAVEQARQQLIASEDTLSTYAYGLGRLVGIDGAVGVTGVDSIINFSLALPDSQIIALAVSAAPAVTAADQSARSQRAFVDAARSEYLPTITLSGGYNWANTSLNINATRQGWLVEVGTAFPLFNGFVRENDVEQAAISADVARSTASDTHRFARSQAEALLSNLRLAQESIQSAEVEVATGEENLRVMFARYRNGVATFLDLTTAQLNEAQARTDLVTARYNYFITRVSLEALLGRSL
jgi:outer membrane protein TolC